MAHVSWVANQQIIMISKVSYDIEDWTNDAENSALHHRNKPLKDVIFNCSHYCIFKWFIPLQMQPWASMEEEHVTVSTNSHMIWSMSCKRAWVKTYKYSRIYMYLFIYYYYYIFKSHVKWFLLNIRPQGPTVYAFILNMFSLIYFNFTFLNVSNISVNLLFKRQNNTTILYIYIVVRT